METDFTAVLVALIAATAAGTGSYWAATRSQKKQPEDRDAVITETVERVLKIVRAELEECMAARDEERARFELERQEYEEREEHWKRQIANLKGRVSKLERQLRDAGITPVNGDSE